MRRADIGALSRAVVHIACLVSKVYILASPRGGVFIIHSPDFPFPRVRSTLFMSTLQPHLATSKVFFNNNFADNTSGYPIPDNNSFGFNGYPFEITNGGFDLETGTDGLSAAEIEDWWLAPKPDGNASQYLGSTFLESFRNELAGPYDSRAGQTPGTSGVNTSESYCGLSSVVDRVFTANNSLG